MKKTLIFTMMFVFLAGAAIADVAMIGTYTSIEGRVDVIHNENQKAIRIKEGDPVFAGDIIRTKSNSKAEVVFKDNSILRLAPSSRLAVEKYAFDTKNRRENATVRLYRGKIRAIVSKNGAKSNFHLITPSSKGVVKGTDIIAFHQADTTGVLVKEGRMSVENPSFPGEIINVTRGKFVTVPVSSAPTESRPYMDAEFTVHEKDTEPVFAAKKVLTGERIIKMRGMITSARGDVRIYRKGQKAPVTAAHGEVLTEGDRIETGEDGGAKISLENGNVLVLSSNSEIFLKRMRMDPESGEYDNSFESEFGKIKAIVEKFGSRSTFEVKTPTAVCAVRGTVMYLNIQASNTTAFYEGGGGLLTSLTTGDTEMVGSGQHSSVDNLGNIAVPAATTTGERMNLEQNWGGNLLQPLDDYGSMRDGGADGALPLTQDERVERINQIIEMVKDELQSNNNLPDNLVPPDPNLPPLPPPTQAVNFAGAFSYVSGGGLQQTRTTSSYLNGMFAFSTPGTPAWGGVSSAAVHGAFANPDGYRIWVHSSDMLRDTAADGGRFNGSIGATMINSKLVGKFLGLFVDPSGWAGTFSSLFVGVYGGGTFDGVGISLFTRRQFLGISPSELDAAVRSGGSLKNGKGIGNFDTGGTVTLDALGGEDFSIEGSPWGIWFVDAQGTYTGPVSDNWTCAVGGQHVDETGNSSWLGTMNGTEWTGNSLRGSLRGFFFSDGSYGPGSVGAGRLFNGDIIGDFCDVSYTWEAIGGGEWAEVTDLLTENEMGFTIAEFNNFVTVPITESYFSNITGTAPGITSATMGISFYENALNQIWAGAVVGTHDGTVTDTWALNLTNADGHNVTLTGDQWSGGEWHANVNGSLPSDSVNYSGEAGGTYNNEGNFQGVGGGTWSEGGVIEG